MKNLLAWGALALLLLPFPALPQSLSRTQLSAQNNQYFYSNGQGKITGPVVNSMNESIISSMGVLGDTNSWTGANSWGGTSTFSGPATFNGLVKFLGAVVGLTKSSGTPLDYGCVGDGITDDTVCLQAAINATATAGIVLWFDGIHTYRVTSPLSSSALVHFEGFAPVGNNGIANAQNCTSGIVTTSNINLLVLSGEKVIINNLCLQLATVGSVASAGCAICLGGSDQQHDVITGNTILRPYDGLVFGNSVGFPNNIVRDSYAAQNVIRDPGHIAIAVGQGTTGGATVGITLIDNRVGCDAGASGTSVGFAFFDGSINWDGTNVGPSSCAINTEIIPGANQNVNGFFKGVVGDSAGTHGGSSPKELYIEPQSATGVIEWLMFDHIWAAGVLPTDTPVYIGNANAGGCSNIKFNGATVHGADNGGTQVALVDIEGCSSIVITGSTIDAWLSGTTTNGILLHNGVTTQPNHITITGNHIGTEAGATLTNGINISVGTPAQLNPEYLVITGNEIEQATNKIVTTGVTSVAGQLWVMGNNAGVEDACGAGIASGTSITIPAGNSCQYVTGSTAVLNVFPAWENRKITLIATDGLTLTTGGVGFPICGSNLVIPATGTAYLQWNGSSSCWMHQ